MQQFSSYMYIYMATIVVIHMYFFVCNRKYVQKTQVYYRYHVGHKMRKAYKILLSKSEGKKKNSEIQA